MTKQERFKLLYEQNHREFDGVLHKKCRQCEKFKPMTKTFFQPNKNKSSLDGFQGTCKECIKNKIKNKPKRKGFNKYEIHGDVTTLFINNDVGEICECYIDTEDLQQLIKLDYAWNLFWSKTVKAFYVRAGKPYYDENGKWKQTSVYLHRLLLNAPKELYVDHINHNTMDNRKCNLRIVENISNTQYRKGKNRNNKSGYRGVFWNTRVGKWQATICVNYKQIRLGFFDDVNEAGRVAEEARQKYFGKYAGFN